MSNALAAFFPVNSPDLSETLSQLDSPNTNYYYFFGGRVILTLGSRSFLRRQIRSFSFSSCSLKKGDCYFHTWLCSGASHSNSICSMDSVWLHMAHLPRCSYPGLFSHQVPTLCASRIVHRDPEDCFTDLEKSVLQAPLSPGRVDGRACPF